MVALIQLAFVAVTGILAGCVAAVATPAGDPPPCGTTHYPTILQGLDEDLPEQLLPNTASPSSDGAFKVAQTVMQSVDGKLVYSRIYQLVAFQNIPPDALECSLGITFPSDYKVIGFVDSNPRAPLLNVTTVLADKPESIVYPNDITFNSYATMLRPADSLFGTVSAIQNEATIINSKQCAPNMAFLFSIAPLEYSANTSFQQKPSDSVPFAGVYLTTNC